MTLNAKQQDALNKAKEWYQHGDEQIFKLAGYAGTGKTYTARAISDEIARCRTAFCAFTGKAALVMRQHGMCAKTIHSLIYDMETVLVKTPSGTRKRMVPVLKEQLYPKPELIIVDEASMVGTQLLEDLLSFDIPVLSIGDPFQLPPVGDEESSLLQTPDIVLDEIVRQDAGSAIPVLADKIRKGLPLQADESVSGIIYQIPKASIDTDLPNILPWAGQIIAARNTTMDALNSKARLIQGFTHTDMPEDGEKLICKRNDWNTILAGEECSYALVNGLIGYCQHIHKVAHHIETPWRSKGDGITYNYIMDFRPTFESERQFHGITFNPESLFCDSAKRRWLKQMIFQFAYCITCHAAQGSEWDNVVLYDDSWPSSSDPQFQARWRYTGVTRAKKQLVWMR